MILAYLIQIALFGNTLWYAINSTKIRFCAHAYLKEPKQ